MTIRILNVVDEFTRVAVACHVSRTIGALEVLATSVAVLRKCRDHQAACSQATATIALT